MIQKLLDFKEKFPFQLVILVALIARIVAVFWAEGYMMFDDHYLIVEPAGGWADGVDVKRWLPGTEGNNGPHFMSFFYVGIVWGLIEFMQMLGLDNPTYQMFFMRLIHGVYSLLIVSLGYKIAKKLGNNYSAFQVGMFLALLAFIPNFSVKQLVEMVCIPPLMASYYYLIKEDNGKPFLNFILAGIMAGLAVGIRYQVGVIYVGIGIVLLFDKKIKETFILATTAGITFFLTQISDIILWHEPFAQLKAYINHNTTHQLDYVNPSKWYEFKYFQVLFGFLVPPVSFFIMFGFFRNWKKFILFVAPVLLFIVFHSLYPNQQERFILPIIPLIVAIGIIGWNEWLSKSKFWLDYYRLNRLAWIFFWLLNTTALVVFSTAYTKRQFVETMTVLKEKGDVGAIIAEDTNNGGDFVMLPKYYLNDWNVKTFNLMEKTNIKELKTWYSKSDISNKTYILFIDDKRKEERIKNFERVFGSTEFVEEVKPGNLDLILYALNPSNKAKSTFIYKLKDE